MNGNELCSGSIRIHDKAMQEKVFNSLGLSPEERDTKFGFMLNAFKYGAPPHGGLAFVMMDAPGEVPETALAELGVKVDVAE